MKRKYKFSIPPRYVLAIISLFCVIMVFVSFKFSDSIAPVKTAVGDIMTPMQKGINKIGSWIYSKKELLVSIEDLTEENRQLKEELASVSYENRILQQNQYQLEELQELYKLDQQYASYPKVGANVISSSTDNWSSTITIDKGSNDGLAVDMNVIANGGLVGIITEVGHNYSKVRLIIDDSNNVSGMFLKTKDTCNVKGNLELIDSGLIEVEMVSKDAKVEDGYEVVTSQISTKYLPGISIGYVEGLEVDSSNMLKAGFLRPAVDFDNLNTVLVITQLKEDLY